MHATALLQESPVRVQQRTRNILNLITLLIVVLVCAWVFSTPLRSPTRLMTFVEDDFYYYLKVAQNVASGRGSTYNGMYRTNGYHPLYLIVLVVISKFAANMAGIFRGLGLVWVVAAAASFLAARKLLERPGTGPLLTNALAVIFLIPCIHIFFQGMEVNLTLPLGLWLMVAFRTQPANWTFWRSAGIGLLAALTVLSRLDSVLFVLLLITFTLLAPEQRRGLRFRQFGGFALGGGPLLLAYFLFNRLYFHTWMPVSGQAKQLKSTFWPTLTGIHSGGLNIKFLGVFLVYAAIAFWLSWRKLTPQERPVLAAAAAFPYLHIGVLSVVSDWPIWGWYYYSLRFAMIAGLVLLLAVVGSAWLERQTLWIKAGAYGLALVCLLQVHWKKDPASSVIYDLAVQIRAFERTHPGVYAMGDAAGMPGYLLTSPLIQTEGLVMDAAYLQHIRRQDPLVPALRTYGVHYYILPKPDDDDNANQHRDGTCVKAEEPDNLSGAVTLHMRGILCDAPVATIVAGPFVAYIFDLSH